MPRPKKVDANSNAPAKINNSQKKTTSSTSKQPTANEMREWYEKNKSRLERYEDATSAITSLRDIQKSSRYTSISNYSKEDVKSYIKNISSNEKNLRSLSRYLYYRSEIYYRLCKYYANQIDLTIRNIVAKYGKTAEDVTFDYAEMSDEELEAKFAEMFDDDNSDGDNSDDGESGEPSNDGEGDGEGASESDGDEGGSQTFEKIVRTYEISHEDTRYALYNLLAPYEESDNDYYYISNVFDSYFVYEGWCTDKIYRQNYTKDGDNVSFDGERIELFRELLTASEKAELESMRSNYAALKEFKETADKNELHAQKEAILNTDNYSVLTEKDSEGNYINADFAELVKTMDNYSVEDFKTKVKVMHSDYISAHANFSSTGTKKNTNSVKMFTNVNSTKKKNNRYGNLKFN